MSSPRFPLAMGPAVSLMLECLDMSKCGAAAWLAAPTLAPTAVNRSSYSYLVGRPPYL